ncbi:MAG: saccharopine dehydrogenase, partial [Candidatus Aminicenantes bacterium]|nr:saccharopine dehydrogenase [Candidatus Aminicenantes bacterium]
GIPEALTVLRGTLRHPGWCEAVRTMVEFGLFDDAPKDRTGLTFDGLMRELSGAAPGVETRAAVARRLGIEPDRGVMTSLAWLGLFDTEPLPAPQGSALDNLAALMTDRLRYEAGERDMIVLQHEFLVRTDMGGMERIVSTLVDYGVPGGDSAMSRTVGLPAAIGARLVLEGKIGRPGVQVPVHPEIYGPILDELGALGIRFEEKRSGL